MFTVIVAVFAVLTTPYLLYAVIATSYATFNTDSFQEHSNVFSVLNYGLFSLSAMNNCTNPLIYSKMHPRMRQVVRNVKMKIREMFCGKKVQDDQQKLCTLWKELPFVEFSSSTKNVNVKQDRLRSSFRTMVESIV